MKRKKKTKDEKDRKGQVEKDVVSPVRKGERSKRVGDKPPTKKTPQTETEKSSDSETSLDLTYVQKKREQKATTKPKDLKQKEKPISKIEQLMKMKKNKIGEGKKEIAESDNVSLVLSDIGSDEFENLATRPRYEIDLETHKNSLGYERPAVSLS